MLLALNKKTAEVIKNKTGISPEQIAKMDVDEIDQIIEKKIGKKLTHGKTFKGLLPRGNVYLFLGRLLSIEYINKKLSKI